MRTRKHEIVKNVRGGMYLGTFCCLSVSKIFIVRCGLISIKPMVRKYSMAKLNTVLIVPSDVSKKDDSLRCWDSCSVLSIMFQTLFNVCNAGTAQLKLGAQNAFLKYVLFDALSAGLFQIAE